MKKQEIENRKVAKVAEKAKRVREKSELRGEREKVRLGKIEDKSRAKLVQRWVPLPALFTAVLLYS